MPRDPSSVLVIGSGVIGAATAYYLAQAGSRVTILDRGQFGHGASHGNCGYVCPSHVLPLAVPGAIRGALSSMFRPNAPFYIPPRLDPALWGWLLRFAGNCHTDQVNRTAIARHALLQSSRRLYEELLNGSLTDCEWEPIGILFVYQTQAEFDHFAAIDRRLTMEFGVSAEPLNGTQLVELEPAIKPGMAGAWYYRCDGHLRSDHLMKSWRRVLEAAGVEIRDQTEFLNFRQEAGRAVAARTSAGEMTADSYVMAAGAWTGRWASELGCTLPIQPGKGYSLTMPRPRLCPKYPMILEEHRVAVTPWKSGYRLGSTMELGVFDDSINPQRLGLLTSGAAHYLHEPACEPVLERWAGLRPMSADDLPIIDFSPRLENVFIAAGHGMVGVAMSPATGRLAAELLLGLPPHVEPGAYRVGRFG